MKRFLKALGYAAAGLIGLLCLLFLIIQTGVFRDYAKTFAVEQVRKSTRANIRVGSIRGNLITGITLENSGFDVEGRELFFAERIEVEYFLPALLRNRVAVSRLSIAGMRGTLRKNPDGTLNIDRIAKPSKERKKQEAGGAPWTIAVREVAISSGTVETIDEAGGGGQRVEGLALRAGFGLAERNGRPVITISVRDLRLHGLRPALNITSLSGTATIDGNTIGVKGIRIETDGSRARIDGTVVTSQYPVFDLRAGFPRVSFGDVRAFVPGIALEGAFSSFVSLKGPVTALKVTHRLHYRELAMRNEALVNLRDGGLSLKSEVRNLNPGNVLPHCGIGISKERCVTGNISFDLDAEVRGVAAENRRASVRLAVKPSVFNGMEIKNAVLDAALDRSRLVISSCAVVSSAGTLELAGGGAVLGFVSPEKDIDLHIAAAVRKADLGAWTGRNALKSDVTLSLSAAAAKPAGMRLQDGLTGGATVQVSPSSIYNVTVTSAALRARYGEGVLTVEECSVGSGPVGVLVNGSIGVDGPLALKFIVDAGDLAEAGRFIPGLTGKGKLRVSGSIGGTMQYPSLSAAVRGKTLSYASITAEEFDGTVNIRTGGRFPSGDLAVRAKALTAGGQTVRQLKASAIGDGESLSFDLDVDRDQLRRYAAAGRVTGLARGGLALRFDNFSVSAGTVAWANPRPLEAEISPAGIVVTRFSLAHGDQSIRCGGRLGTRGAINFDVDISSAEIGDLAMIAGADVGIAGRLSGAINVRGDALAPDGTGQLILADGSTGNFSFDALILAFGYRAKLLSLELSLDRKRQRLLEVRGRVPVDLSAGAAGGRFAGEGLDIRLRSRNFNPQFLSAFVREIEKADGDLSLDIALTGNPVRPTARGTIVIDNAMLRLSPIGTDYREINGRIVIDGGTLSVERLSLKSGDGRADLKGRVLFRGMEPYDADMTLACRTFKVMDGSVFSGTIDADLKLAGSSETGSLTGKITVLESNVTIPAQTKKQVREIEIIEKKETGKSAVRKKKGTPPFIANIAADVAVNVPGGSWVKGQGVNAELKGSVRLRQERGKPAYIVGRIETVRGTYEFRGRLLNVERGVVSFTGEQRLNANLDVQASERISDVRIIVLVGGTLDKPAITLKSEPAMDESQILSYLIFGKPPDRLNEQESRLVQSTAIQVLGGVAARGLKDVLGKQFAPDVINISSSGGESSFAVGKYLTEKLFVRYEWRLGTEEVTQTVVDYKLDKHFNLHSQFGTERNSGVDLLWAVNY